MADIIQTLGFDASGAIAAIGQLNNALTTLNTKLIDVAQSARVINGLNLSAQLSAMAKASASAATSTQSLGNNASNSLNKASASANKFVLSLETISRIALAQVLVRAFGTIQQQMSEAIQTAEEFNIKLAETVAVSPRGLENFQGQLTQLKGELIAASNAFGFDILDVTNAKLQEFQNQVKGSANSTALFDSALKLARISGSDVTQTVNALSSVLNSYGQSVEQADSVSAALFKTVEVGRVQLKDIADELGNVTPLARAAGIGFNEVAASLARITQAGVSPSRALTEIKSLINQLQKPTKELKAIFQNVLNVSGLEEGVQRFGGFKNLLDAINTELAGNAQRTAAAFNEIKAQNAFEVLTQDGEKFADALTKIGDAAIESTTFLDNLLEKFNAQEAVQFRIALTNLNNEFLQLADKALPLLTRFINGLSVSLGNLNATFQNVAAVGLTVYASRMIAAVGVTKTLNAQAGLAGTVGLAGLGVGIGVVINQLARYIDKSAAAAEQAKILAAVEGPKQDAFRTIDAAAIKATKDFEKLSAEGIKALGAISKASEATSRQFLDANNAFVASVEGSLDNILDSRSKLVSKLEKLVSDSEGNITKNHQDQTSIREKISDREFDNRTKNLDALKQSFLQNQRAQEELSKAQRQEGGARTDEGLKERLRLLERAEQIANEAASTAASTGNRAAVAKAEQTITEILQAQLSIKKQQEALDLAQAKIAKDNLASQKANLEQLKDAVKDFKDNVSLFRDNQLISPEQRDEAQKRAQEALQKIEKFALESKGISISEFLGVTTLKDQLQSELNNVKVNFTSSREALLNTIEQTVQGQVANIPVKFIVEQGQQLGLDLSQIDVLNPLASLEEALAKVKTGFVESTEADKQFARANEESVAQIKAIKGLLDNFGTGEAVQVLQDAFTKLSEKTFLTTKDIENFLNVVQQMREQGRLNIPGTNLFGGEVERINGLTAALEKLQATQKQAIGARQAAPQGRTQELRNLQELLTGQLQLQQKADQFRQSITKSGEQAAVLEKNIEAGVVNSTQMNDKYQALIRLIQQAEQEQKDLNRAQSQAPGPSAPATAPRSRMFGGPMQYFSNGGWVRGTDRILAALTPGETVINARSSRKFAPQIAAMNAGVQPVYRAEGGPVVNNSITVGDINVNGAVGPVATGRSVVAELRREFRRGTSSRF